MDGGSIPPSATKRAIASGLPSPTRGDDPRGAPVTRPLPSWRDGATRDAIIAFLERSVEVPVDDRVAYVDNDGTTWCEKPTYVQFDFFVDALGQRVTETPALRARPEFAAALDGDMAAIGESGLAKVAGALAGWCDGPTP